MKRLRVCVSGKLGTYFPQPGIKHDRATAKLPQKKQGERTGTEEKESHLRLTINVFARSTHWRNVLEKFCSAVPVWKHHAFLKCGDPYQWYSAFTGDGASNVIREIKEKNAYSVYNVYFFPSRSAGSLQNLSVLSTREKKIKENVSKTLPSNSCAQQKIHQKKLSFKTIISTKNACFFFKNWFASPSSSNVTSLRAKSVRASAPNTSLQWCTGRIRQAHCWSNIPCHKFPKTKNVFEKMHCRVISYPPVKP